MMAERKKRGRPPLPPFRLRWATSKDDKPTAADEAVMRELTAEDIALFEAMRNRGGRPVNHKLNQELLDVVHDVKRRGISLKAGLEKFIARKHGDVENLPDWVAKYRRRIERLRPNRRRQSRALVGASDEKSQ
jgi:hypothetical protein